MKSKVLILSILAAAALSSMGCTKYVVQTRYVGDSKTVKIMQDVRAFGAPDFTMEVCDVANGAESNCKETIILAGQGAAENEGEE